MSQYNNTSLRSSQISSSPIPNKNILEKTSLKISLIKLNDSFSKQESESRPSQSLNYLPQISKIKNLKEKLPGQQKNVLIGDQSPSFISHFSSYDRIKHSRYLSEEDLKIQNSSNFHEDIFKKREFLRNKREEIYKFEPNINPKLYQANLHLSLLLKTYSEDFLQKQIFLKDESLFQALSKICEIETFSYKIYEDFIKEIKILQESVSEYKKKNLLLIQKNEKLQMNLDEVLLKLQKKEKKINPKEKETGFLMFENSRLEMEIQKLNEKLKFYENYDIGPIMKELESTKVESEEKIKKLTGELLIYKGKDDNHQNIINFYKNNIVKLEKEVKHWIQTSGENQKIIDKLTEKNEKLVGLYNKYREVSFMQNEELQILYAKKHENHLTIHELNEKIKILTIKIDKLTAQKGDNLNEQDFKNDLNLLVALSEIFSDNLFKHITKDNPISQQLIASLSTKFPNLVSTRSYESNAKHPTFLKKMNFLRAPFFKLIEHRLKMTNFSVKLNKKPNFHELLTKIRAIFDCKYNEFLMFSDCKLYTSFPDFVYSWLGKYEVDYSTRKIKKVDPFAYNKNTDDIRIQFLLELNNSKIEKLWECSTFCEFFEEKLALDELFFYLHCRNLLFKGPQLQDFPAFFDYIHYVSFERAEKLVDLIMHKFELTIKTTIKSKLADKSKRKGPRMFIDGAFVLRILLEYYRLERIDKFYLLEELFKAKMHKEEDRETVSFENFKKIIQFNWPQITDLETAELFRETWGIGQGGVTAEAFFTLASENRFFIKTMKLPSVVFFGENLPLERNLYEIVRKEFFILFESMKNKVSDFDEIIDYLGLEMLEEKFRRMIKTIQADFQMPSEEFKEKFISHFFIDFIYLLNTILKISKQNEIVENPLKEIDFMKNKEEFKILGGISKEITKSESLRLIKENSYARKIQKAFKKKKNMKNNVAQVVRNVKKQK